MSPQPSVKSARASHGENLRKINANRRSYASGLKSSTPSNAPMPKRVMEASKKGN